MSIFLGSDDILPKLVALAGSVYVRKTVLMDVHMKPLGEVLVEVQLVSSYGRTLTGNSVFITP